MLCCRRFRRLYPDSAVHVETERLEAVQASLLGVFASHALLMAFALKLKMSAALKQPDRSARQPGEAGCGREGQICGGAVLLCVRVRQLHTRILHLCVSYTQPRLVGVEGNNAAYTPSTAVALPHGSTASVVNQFCSADS